MIDLSSAGYQEKGAEVSKSAFPSALRALRTALPLGSRGKDSAYALHLARERGDFDIVAVLTTLTEEYSRVSMHGAREELLDRQAEALGLPCFKVKIPARCPPEGFTGRNYDVALLDTLPRGVDPCGEKGELHTSVSGGPMFTLPIDIKLGLVVEREGFVFTDLLPA